MLKAVWPLVIIDLALLVCALIDLLRRPAQGIRGPKWIWVLVVVLIGTLGPIAYLAFGRETS